jgi:hypothetical protein
MGRQLGHFLSLSKIQNKQIVCLQHFITSALLQQGQKISLQQSQNSTSALEEDAPGVYLSSAVDMLIYIFNTSFF